MPKPRIDTSTWQGFSNSWSKGPKISKVMTPLWLQLEITEAMTKIFSWKAILTKTRCSPTLPPCCSCFNNNINSPCSLHKAEPNSTQHQGLRLTVFDALGRICHTPQVQNQVGHPVIGNHHSPKPSRHDEPLKPMLDTKPVPSPSRRPEKRTDGGWRGAARNPGTVHQGS